MTNRSSRFFPKALMLTALALVAAPALAQHDHGGGDAAESAAELPESFSEPMPLFEAALGDHHHAISTDNEKAQAYFDQGFRLMYAFGKEDAVRSFRESWKHDPDCAICYWGEAWAWGSYLNGPMRPFEAPHAYAAMQEAVARIDGASPRERAYIEAITTRYVEDFDPATRRDQDEAYAEAMRELSEAYPDDLDAVTLYGDALFLLEPRRGTRDLNDPNVQRLHGVLESVLDRDITHPGACHLYIHATESTVNPGLASGCAEHLGSAIPGASHINHMPSHTWNEIGRWADGVRANLDAWHSDLKAEVGEGVAIYPSHNLHMLLFAASMDGQGAIAIQAGKDFAKLTGDSVFHVLTLVRFGRFDEVIEVTERPEQDGAGGLWDFAQGYAHLRTGDADFAQVYLDRVLTLADETKRALPLRLGRAAAEDRRRHPGGRDPTGRRPSARRHRVVRAGRRGGGPARVLGAGAAAVRRASLAGRGAAGGRALRRRRAGLPRGAGGPSEQRLVAARAQAGARRAGQGVGGRRGRVREELGPIGHLDGGVAVLVGCNGAPGGFLGRTRSALGGCRAAA